MRLELFELGSWDFELNEDRPGVGEEEPVRPASLLEFDVCDMELPFYTVARSLFNGGLKTPHSSQISITGEETFARSGQ